MMSHADVRRRKASFVEFLDSLSGVCIVFKVSRDGFGSNLILGHNVSPFLGGELSARVRRVNTESGFRINTCNRISLLVLSRLA